MVTFNKIFCIGLSRTGTLSLSVALSYLGIKTKHWPHNGKTYEELSSGQYSLSVLKEYQGLADTPIPAFYAQLDKAYPGSKFILTLRDKEPWLNSCERLFGRQPFRYDRLFSFFERTVVYGCYHFNKERFGYVYDVHHHLVREYFKERQNDLLEMNIIDGDGWNKLCAFLEVPIPTLPFPHEHRWSQDDIQTNLEDPLG